MSINLAEKIGTGLSPEAFVSAMTRNQEALQAWRDRFSWPSIDDQAFFQSLQWQGVHCIIIAADWCGDVVRNAPVVFQLVEQAGIPTEVLILEDNLDVMDQFLTMGGRSIPVVLFLDPSGNVLGKWGPRPRHVQEVMEQFKATHHNPSEPGYDLDLKATRQELMRRYGEGTEYQTLIVREIRALIEQIVQNKE